MDLDGFTKYAYNVELRRVYAAFANFTPVKLTGDFLLLRKNFVVILEFTALVEENKVAVML